MRRAEAIIGEETERQGAWEGGCCYPRPQAVQPPVTPPPRRSTRPVHSGPWGSLQMLAWKALDSSSSWYWAYSPSQPWILFCYPLFLPFKFFSGSSIVAQWKQTRLVSKRTWVRSLAPLSRLKDLALLWAVVQATDTAWIWRCCGCGVGWQLQLWLDSLAWELSYAVGVVLKSNK